uniref:condensation domain-containing protein n=1 Tax=Mycolicibacterium baixiangningiae TaxID=2761578 RepID=UPI0038CC1A4D
MSALKTPDTAESHLTELLAEARATQFDSSHDVLIRALLIRIAPERHLLSLVNHHLILDGWSMPVLLRELLSIYEHHGSDSALPTPIPYRRFFEWLETNVDHDASLSAWEELLTRCRTLPHRTRNARRADRDGSARLCTPRRPLPFRTQARC